MSVADITRDGPFSAFECVDRAFAVLRGEGVRLGDSARRCDVESEVFAFDGALAPDASCTGDGLANNGAFTCGADQAAQWREGGARFTCTGNSANLADGDSVTVIKDLKVKGSSSVVKVGTKVKGIRLVDSTDGHNIACRIDGIGPMQLKSEFVRKA